MDGLDGLDVMPVVKFGSVDEEGAMCLGRQGRHCPAFATKYRYY